MPNECVSTSATADIHTYFLRRSAIKFTFLLKKKHASTSTNGIGDAQASQKRGKGRPEEDDNYQKTSIDGAAQKWVKRKQDGGG